MLSMLFAGVETYAAAYIIQAWRQAKPGTQPGKALFGIWRFTLLVLVVVMPRPIFANTIRIEFHTLPPLILLLWSICVAASTFLVVGGVGYAAKTRTLKATLNNDERRMRRWLANCATQPSLTVSH